MVTGGVGVRGKWEVNEIPDLRAAELLTCLKRLAMAEMWKKLNSIVVV